MKRAARLNRIPGCWCQGKWRLLPLCILAVCLQHMSAAGADDGLDRIRQRGTLVWGADQEGGGPFVFPDPNDPAQRTGFEVELAELIAEQLGVRAEFSQGQWDKLPDLLDRGDIDIVLNGYEWSANRAERYGVSVPYYIYELQLLGRTADDSIKSWDDLLKPADGQKRRVSLLGGSAAQDYVEKFGGDKIEIALFDGATDAMEATELSLSGIDANVQDLPIWIFYSKGFPKLRVIGPPVGRGYYVAMTRKGDRDLLKAVNEILLKALQDGRLRKIFAKYGIWNETQMMRGLETDATGSFVGSGAALPADGESTAQEATSYQPSGGWNVIRQRGGLLVKSAGMTGMLSITAMPIAVFIGLLIALARLYGPWYLGKPAAVYVEVVRGTPLVLQLYLIYFLVPKLLDTVFPGMELTINAFAAAVMGLAINYSAYEAEIYRGGIQSIPRGQMEAAISLGMSRSLALRRIIVPQATRIVLPPMTNDFIALFKDTAVCSVITVVELSKEYYIQARSAGAIVELGLLTALLYLAMSYPLSVMTNRMEKNLNQERRG
ncbi:MAG: ABC transporter substrate-binding protein/permease [Planctomycetota bacterium]|nr:ABC transporter substrate-binding protein/permease [Planctomycetota bacterium]